MTWDKNHSFVQETANHRLKSTLAQNRNVQTFSRLDTKYTKTRNLEERLLTFYLNVFNLLLDSK